MISQRNTLKLVYEPHANPEDLQKLNEGISQYAKLKKQQKAIESFSFFVRDEQDRLMGGCHGSMYYACLYVDILWVDEAVRQQGWGRQLMLSAEKLAQEKECLFATVNTMDWEAREFYKKLGYQIEFERTGYHNQSTLYFLRKSLI